MLRRLYHACTERRAIAASELALVAPVLILLLLSTFDVANSVQTSLRLERAARAGAQYAIANSADMEAIRSRVIADWPELTTSEVPLPVLACTCANVTALCTATCAGGMVKTITITAKRTVTGFLLTSLPQPKGDAVVRLQ